MTELKRVSHDPLDARFHRTSAKTAYSDRTRLILRAYDLEKLAEEDTISTLIELQKHIHREFTQDLVYAFTEIAYFEAKEQEVENPKLATEIYFASMMHAYKYLFDPRFDRERNHYDSQFRSICLLYNNSLLQILRLFGDEYELSLAPEHTYAIRTLDGSCSITCKMRAEGWNGDQIERFKFAADYEIKGLQNEYRQYGLGVPLIAIRKSGQPDAPEEKYYPPGLCFPVTALLRPRGFEEKISPASQKAEPAFYLGSSEKILQAPVPFPSPQSFPDEIFQGMQENGFVHEQESLRVDFEWKLDQSPLNPLEGVHFHAVLELYDPLVCSHVRIGDQRVPLESDLTTPLAYFLSNPMYNKMGVIGLLRPDELFKSRFLPSAGKEIALEEKRFRRKRPDKDGSLSFAKASKPNTPYGSRRSRASYELPLEPDNPLSMGADNERNSRSSLSVTQWDAPISGDSGDDSDSSSTIRGIYMMQPYDPEKIPVVMVHGLGSSPMTWVEMFNNLRSLPEIREHYQFWFYYYPSAQPFWVSASQLREDLAEVQRTLNPSARKHEALDRMILIGHSMGGLISRMQTIESGNRVWNLVSDLPFESIAKDPEAKEQMRKWFFFESNPSINRVITIATPFRGSDFANNFTQWISQKAIRIPNTITSVASEFTTRQDPSLKKNSLLKMQTSVDSLSPKNPLFPVLTSSTPPPGTHNHNIVGLQEHSEIMKLLNAEGDGVVKLKSARIRDVESEITVPSTHSSVHTHPRAILEVRRILLDNLRDEKEIPSWSEFLRRSADAR